MLMQQLIFLISCLCTVVVANSTNEFNVHVFINRYNAYGRANIITTLDSLPEAWFTTRVTMKVRILVDFFQTNVSEHQGAFAWYRTANLRETLDFYDVKIEKDLPYVKGHFHVSRVNFFQSGHFLINAIITTEGLYDNAVTAKTYTIVKLMQGNACEPKFDIPSCFDSNRPQYYETSKEIVLRANFSRFCPMDTFIQYHWTLHDSTDAKLLEFLGATLRPEIKLSRHRLSVRQQSHLSRIVLVRLNAKIVGRRIPLVARCYLSLASQRLFPVIRGGNYRRVFRGKTISISGSLSKDLSLAREGPQHLEYKWSCTAKMKQHKNVCKKDMGTRDRIIIPPYSQPNNQTLHVVLLIRSAFDPIRTASSRQKLDFALSPHLINLEVACVRNCEENKYYPGKPIHLRGKCEGVGNKNITKWEWLVDGLPVEGHANRLIYTEKDLKKQNVSIHLNVEAAHLYNPSYNYYGEDWIFLEKNIGPTDTKCTIVPRDGYAFETLFMIQCQRSQARFMPLRYCVEVGRVLIIDWQSNREMVVRLIPTSKVFVKICDKLDVCENVELKVWVQTIPIPEKESEVIADHLARVRHWLEYADWQKAYPMLSLISKVIKTKEMLVVFTDTLAAHVPQSTVELTQLVRLTKNVVVTIQPLDDMKALILARMFHRITSTYKLIVESNDLTLLDEYYEQMTSDMCDMLDIINAEWEYIPKAHCLTESESCININNFGKRLEQLSSLRPLLEHVDNWMYAYWKLSNCLIYMGMETARRLHPHEGPRLIKKDSFTIHMESFDLDYQRSLQFESADSMHTLSFSWTLLRELRRRLRHNEVLISVRSHKISQYWWYPKKRSRTQELVVNAFTTSSMFLPSAPLLEPLKFFARLQSTPKIDIAERDRRTALFGGPEEEAYAVIHDNVYTPFEVRMYRTEIYAKSVLKVTFIRAQIDYDVLIRMTNVPKLEDMDVAGATCRVKYGIEQRTNFLLRNRCDEARSAFIYLRAANPSESWDNYDQNGAYFSFATEIHICRAWNSSGTEHSWQKISCMPEMIKSTNSGVHCSCNVIGDFDVDAMPIITVPVNIKCHLDRPSARRHYDMLIVYVLITVLTVIYIIHHMKKIRHWDRQLCVADYYTRALYYRGDIVLRLTFGGRLNAGSSGNIIVSLKSSQGTVQMIVYQDPICKSFLRNSTVSFRIQRELVQVPAEIAIGHDDSGIYPHFFCRTVVLTDMHTGQTQTFLIHKWLRGAPNTSRYISAPVFYFAKTTEKEVYPWRARFAHILEISMGGWYLFQPIIGPWRIGTHCSSFCRWERSCIFIVKIFVTICIVVQYFGPSYVALSCDPSPKKYHDLSSVFWVALICFITTALVQAAMEKTILLIGYYDHI
ncbi:uncharacterized protein LOC108164998 [Drosophila miranda]|uniref:uncharacterized protein LOC108164998 n=1 Tax=Drosophila miranda TaxID=7229 RepID=UPI00143F6587|nr:uncharacterized protein LOC108164998 [Drosophila miranda]XP_033245341.1 uncharacterized protein LOC108164998 [Drosophila miranda]